MIPGTPETCRESHLPGVGKPQTRQGLRFRVSESPKLGKDHIFRGWESPQPAEDRTFRGSEAPNPPGIAPSGCRNPQTQQEIHFPGVESPKTGPGKRPSRQPKLPQQLTSKQPRAGCGPPRPFPVKPAPRLDGASGAPLAREDFSAGGSFFCLRTSPPPHTGTPAVASLPRQRPPASFQTPRAGRRRAL